MTLTISKPCSIQQQIIEKDIDPSFIQVVYLNYTDQVQTQNYAQPPTSAVDVQKLLHVIKSEISQKNEIHNGIDLGHFRITNLSLDSDTDEDDESDAFQEDIDEWDDIMKTNGEFVDEIRSISKNTSDIDSDSDWYDNDLNFTKEDIEKTRCEQIQIQNQDMDEFQFKLIRRLLRELIKMSVGSNESLSKANQVCQKSEESWQGSMVASELQVGVFSSKITVSTVSESEESKFGNLDTDNIDNTNVSLIVVCDARKLEFMEIIKKTAKSSSYQPSFYKFYMMDVDGYDLGHMTEIRCINEYAQRIKEQIPREVIASDRFIMRHIIREQEFGFVSDSCLTLILQYFYNDDKIVAMAAAGIPINNYRDKRYYDREISQQIVGKRSVSDRLLNDSDFIAMRLAVDGCFLSRLSEHWQNDRGMVKLAIQQNGSAIEYASAQLRDDMDLVKIAIMQNGNAIEYASERLRDDMDLVIKIAIMQNEDDFVRRELMARTNSDDSDYFVLDLRPLSSRLRDNKDLVKIAIMQNGFAIQYASERLRDDNELVKIAIMQNGLAIEYASERLRDDNEQVKIAIMQNGLAIEYASERLRDDNELVKIAIEHDRFAVKYASNRLKDDEELMLMALQKNPGLTNVASDRLKDDEDFVRKLPNATEVNEYYESW